MRGCLAVAWWPCRIDRSCWGFLAASTGELLARTVVTIGLLALYDVGGTEYFAELSTAVSRVGTWGKFIPHRPFVYCYCWGTLAGDL